MEEHKKIVVGPDATSPGHFLGYCALSLSRSLSPAGSSPEE